MKEGKEAWESGHFEYCLSLWHEKEKKIDKERRRRRKEEENDKRAGTTEHKKKRKKKESWGKPFITFFCTWYEKKRKEASEE